MAFCSIFDKLRVNSSPTPCSLFRRASFDFELNSSLTVVSFVFCSVSFFSENFSNWNDSQPATIATQKITQGLGVFIMFLHKCSEDYEWIVPMLLKVEAILICISDCIN